MVTEPRQVLVTGATSGIGRAIAERLLDGGHRVVGVGRNFGKLPALTGEFVEEIVDLADLDTLSDRVTDLARRYPRIDAIAFCAGRGHFGSLEEFSYADIRALIDLNFTSQVFLARAFLPSMKRRTGPGDLVFIGSEAGLQGKRRGAVYCAGKFALRGLAQALRAECSRAGVRVSVVNPGMVRTPFFDDLDFEPGEDESNYILPADVAGAVEMILTARAGTVFDEIHLSPLKNVLRFRPGKAAERTKDDAPDGED